MYKEKFVLSIVHGGYPVKETGNNYNRQVAIPFNSEYKILLKNKNDRKCTASVFIDGRPVSKIGDFIINANGSLHLERFLDSSLKEGKKFKFVPLTDPSVDDPTSTQNGIIKVEFRLAKEKNGLCIKPNRFTQKDPWKPSDPWIIYHQTPQFIRDGTNSTWKPPDPWIIYHQTPQFTRDGTNSTSKQPHSKLYYSNSNFSMTKTVHDSEPVSVDSIVAMTSVESGATIEGGRSYQEFSYSNLEVGSSCVTLKLKIVGIKDVNNRRYGYRFCSNCGSKIKKRDKYCSNCGKKL